MKPIFTKIFSACIILNGSLANAQSFCMRQQPFPLRITVAGTAAIPTAKVTAINERLMATSNYGTDAGSYKRLDSSRISWSFGRGSKQYPIPSSQVDIYQKFDVQETWKDISGSLQSDHKEMNTFNSDGNISTSIQLNWNSATSLWENVTKLDFNYTLGMQTEGVGQTLDDATSKWENSYRNTTVYTGGKLAKIFEESWNKSSAKWENSAQILFTYTATTNENLTQMWNSLKSSWENFSREVQVYSGANMISRNTYLWDATTSTWENQYQTFADYTGVFCTEFSNETWDKSTNSWSDKRRGLNTYTGSDLTNELDQKWNYTTSNWEDIFQINYTFLPTEVTVDYQNPISGGGWMNNSRTVAKYNTNQNLVSSTGYYWVSSAWQLSAASFFYYEEYSTAIREGVRVLSQASIYPNPVTAANAYVDFFTEKNEPTEIVLSNTLGRELYRTSEKAGIGDHSVRIPVSNLPSGIYNVSIYSAGQLCNTLKLVK